MRKTWIKLYTQMLDWEHFYDAPTLQVFLYLLLTANTEDKQWNGITVKRGQLVTTTKKLSETLNLSPMQLRTILKKLSNKQNNKQNNKQITIETTNKFSLITIVKYNDFQSLPANNNKQNNKQITNKLTNKLTTTIEYKDNISKDIYHQQQQPRVRERGLQEEISEMLADRSWQEAVLMKFHLTDLSPFLSEFATHCRARGLETHENLRDAKGHFCDWLRIRIKANDYGNENKTGTGSDRSRRRVSLRVTPQADYEGTF